jgi:hypothetical protein
MFRRILVVLTIIGGLALALTVVGSAHQLRKSQVASDSTSSSAPDPGFPERFSNRHQHGPHGQTPDQTSQLPYARGQRTPQSTSGGLRQPQGVSFSGLGGGPFSTSYFFDDMESGTGTWTATGLWHLADAGSSYPNPYNGAASWWYGLEATGNYDNGVSNSGSLQSAIISLPGDAPAAYLRFYSWEFTEGLYSDFDSRIVSISTDGSSWTPIYTSTNSIGNWYEVQLDLSAYIGDDISIKFTFDTVDDTYNDYPGWYVDDVAVGYDPIQVINTVAQGSGAPGSDVGYDTTLQNNTGSSTSIDITPSGGWTASFPASSPALSPGDTYDFTGLISVPGAAAFGVYSNTQVTYSSAISPSLETTQYLQTWSSSLELVSYTITEDGSGTSTGNGNDQIDPGEVVEIQAAIKNNFDSTAYGVEAYFDDLPDTVWANNDLSFGDIAPGETVTVTQPFRLGVYDTMPRGTQLDFTLNLGAPAFPWSTAEFSQTVPYDIDLTRSQMLAGLPGEVVTYTVVLSNNTSLTDTFDLTATANTWSVNLAPTSTSSLVAGDSQGTELEVQIPGGAALGSIDTSTYSAQGAGPAAGYSQEQDYPTFAGVMQRYANSTSTNGWSLYFNGNHAVYAEVYVHTARPGLLDAYFYTYNPDTGQEEEIATQTGGGSGILYRGPLDPSRLDYYFYLYSDIYTQLSYDVRFFKLPGVYSDPESLRGTTQPDTDFVSQASITNETGETSAFTLTVSGNTWPISLFDSDGTTPITETPSLSNGSSFDFVVQVEVPPSATPGDTDAGMIEFLPQSGAPLTGTLPVETRAADPGGALAYGVNPNSGPLNSIGYYDPLSTPGSDNFTQSRDELDFFSLSAYRLDNQPIAWTRYFENDNNIWVNELYFGLADEQGNLLYPAVKIMDYTQSQDELNDYEPSLAVDPTTGNTALVWTHESYDSQLDNWLYNVYAAVFDPQGNELLPPTSITNNTDDFTEDYSPAVEAYRSGGFAVSWEHYSDTSDQDSIYLAVLDGQGNIDQSPYEILPTSGGLERYAPRFVQLATGNLMLVFNCEIDNPYISEACYTLVDHSGTMQGDLVALTDYGSTPVLDNEAGSVVGINLSSGEIILNWLTYENRQAVYTILDSDLNTLIPPTGQDIPVMYLDDYSNSLTENDAGGASIFFEGYRNRPQMYQLQVMPDGSTAGVEQYSQQLGEPSLSYSGRAAGGNAAQRQYMLNLPAISK